MLTGVKQEPNATEEEISPKLGHRGKVTCIDGDTDGKRVISGGVDHKLLLWNLEGGLVTKVFNRQGFHEAAILSVRWSYEKEIFASCSADACVYLWSTKYSIPLISFIGHHFAVDKLLFINSHKLLSSGRDSFILVWDIKVGGVVDSEMKHGKEMMTKVEA
jgi:WD40 repeat protein